MLEVKIFIPEIFRDRVDKSKENIKNIPDSDSKTTGFYRFYGIFVESEKRIGYIKYHILFDSPTIEIDRIEVGDSYQRKGYGTLLINQSLADLVTDFSHIENVTVCSTPGVIPFYIMNDFAPYFGDNNLIRTLQQK